MEKKGREVTFTVMEPTHVALQLWDTPNHRVDTSDTGEQRTLVWSRKRQTIGSVESRLS